MTLTFEQIWAILYLLIAFNTPQPTVDLVQSILMPSATTTISAPLPQSSLPIGSPVEEEVTRVTPSMSLSLGGVTGTTTVTNNGCIVGGVKTCATAGISWTTTGYESCGITATPYIGWAGNFGTSGQKLAEFHGETTVTLQCNSASSTDYATLNVLTQ